MGVSVTILYITHKFPKNFLKCFIIWIIQLKRVKILSTGNTFKRAQEHPLEAKEQLQKTVPVILRCFECKQAELAFNEN